MTNEEAKAALFNRTPVRCNGIDYLYISAIIYRTDKYNNLTISAEMLDKNQRSITIAPLKDVISTYDSKNQATAFLH